MARFYALVFGLIVVLTVVALISCLSAERGEVRGLPRVLWAFLIVLVPLLGSIAYFALGRPRAATSPWRAPGIFQPDRTRPLAPDDDPDFLGRFERQRRPREIKSAEDDIRQWEEDLRRTEDPRKTEDTPPADS